MLFLLKKFFCGSLVRIVIVSVGFGILAAFMLPMWLLAMIEAILILVLGFMYIT